MAKKNETKSNEPNLFTVINAINRKEHIASKTVEEQYVPFLVNFTFSLFPDTILAANIVNRYPELTKQQQFDYYYNVVNKRNRFKKWPTRNIIYIPEVRALAEYYKCNLRTALEYYNILTEDQRDHLKKMLHKGGREDE